MPNGSTGMFLKEKAKIIVADKSNQGTVPTMYKSICDFLKDSFHVVVYELLVSNIGHQMNEKLLIQNKYSSLIGKLSIKLPNSRFQQFNSSTKKIWMALFLGCCSLFGCRNGQ